MRSDFAFGKFTNTLPELLLLFRERKIQGSPYKTVDKVLAIANQRLFYNDWRVTAKSSYGNALSKWHYEGLGLTHQRGAFLQLLRA